MTPALWIVTTTIVSTGAIVGLAASPLKAWAYQTLAVTVVALDALVLWRVT